MGNLTIAPPPTTTDVQARVQAALSKLRELPAAAPVVHKALKLMENPDSAINDLKKTLMGDQAVAARILRLANSAYFGFRSEVQTVSQAVVLLGQERIRTLLRRILVDKLWGEMAHGHSAAALLRERSIATATASCTMSQLLAREDAEQVLLAGLLHNIGELFLVTHFPDEFERAGELARNQPRAEAELAVFGLTAGGAGRMLVESWNFPPLYAAVVEHCDDPLSAGCPAEFAFVIALVYAGKQLARAMMEGAEVVHAVALVSSDVCEAFSLEADLLGEVFQCLPERMSLEQLQAGRK